MKRRDLGICLLLFGASLALNLIGVDWGVPSRERSPFYGVDASYFETTAWDRMVVTSPYDSFHPDEGALLNALTEMHPGAGDFNPRFFDYPSLWIYATGATLFAGAKVGLITLVPSKVFYIEHPGAMARMYLAGRALTAAFSALGAALLYLIVCALFGRTFLAISSAVALLATPLWVRDSHFLIVNIPSTVWMILSALLAVLAVRRKRTVLLLVLSGLAAGLAASTKYNAGAAILFPVFIALRPVSHPGRKPARTVLLPVAGAAVFAFLIGTPYALLASRKFLDDVLFQAGDKMGVPPLPTLFANLVVAQGTVLAVLGIAGALIAAARLKERRYQFLALWLLAGLATSLISNADFMRYLIPALPPLAICVGLVLESVHAKVGTALARFPGARVGAALPLLLLLFPLAYALDMDFVMSRRPDARIESARWIASEIPKGTEIGLIGRIWFDTPPINAVDYRLTDLSRAVDARPPLVIATPEGMTWYRSWPGNGSYELSKVFRQQPREFHTYPIRRRPRDWTYTFPDIFVYRRAG